MSGLFVTGGSGFVGRRLLPRLARSDVGPVTLLARDASSLGDARSIPPGWTVVEGDVTDPSGWEEALAGCDTVLHMAAVTGKAPESVYREVNATATAELAARAAAGRRRFLFVSSIAACFTGAVRYHYGRSKRVAEEAVRTAGADFAIIRPTMIFGAGSPVFRNLGKLATLPVPVAFGSGGTRVQPVHVDDVVEVILGLLGRDVPGDPILEVGGPEVVTIDALLLRIRRIAKGTEGGRVVHVPIGPLRAVLGALEPVALSLLPFTAGQLASFWHDGVAEESAVVDALLPDPTGLDEMIADSLREGPGGGGGPRAPARRTDP